MAQPRTAPVHHAAWRHGCGVAVRGAGARDAQQAHGLITLPAPGAWRPEERKRADIVMLPKR
jgi:hypothetical protein